LDEQNECAAMEVKAGGGGRKRQLKARSRISGERPFIIELLEQGKRRGCSCQEGEKGRLGRDHRRPARKGA